MLYFSIITLAVLLILSVNISIAINTAQAIGSIFVHFFFTVAFCGLVSVLVMLIIHRLPKKIFNPFSTPFKTYNFEKNLFKFLKVKTWKDKVPELGRLGGFEKNKLKDPTNPEYLYEFLVDSCKSEAIHTLSAIFAIFILFFTPIQYKISIALPVFITNFICHMMPSIIQRYMRPRLIKIYEMTKKRYIPQATENFSSELSQDEIEDESMQNNL